MTCPLHLVLLELEPRENSFFVFFILLLLLARDKAQSGQHHTRKGVHMRMVDGVTGLQIC